MTERRWPGVVAVLLLAALVPGVMWLSGRTRPTAAQTMRVFIDADTADGICDLPEDSSVSVLSPASFDVAVCLESPPSAVGAFSFDLIYDDTVILAPEVADAAPALDDNPDANQAALGGAWDCSGFELAFPTGDSDLASGPGHGEATIDCLSLTGPWTFTSTGPLAVIHFEAQSVVGGTELAVENVVIGDKGGAEIGSCNPAVGVPMTCVNGTVSVDGGAPPPPTPTQPTSAATPTATSVAGAPTPTSTSTPGSASTPASTSTPPSPTPTPAPTPPPEEADVLDLVGGCNAVVNTYRDGTSVQTLAAAVSSPGLLGGIWKFVAGVWSAYSPEFAQASDLTAVDFLDVVFLCVDGPSTFVRPLV